MREHRMQLAKVSPQYAKRHGLSSNHHARVWCTCMDDPVNPPGTFSERPSSVVANDPRRLGTYDHLGVIDLREPSSGFRLWKKHVESTKTHRG